MYSCPSLSIGTMFLPISHWEAGDGKTPFSVSIMQNWERKERKGKKRENLQHLPESGAFCLTLTSGCICFLVNKVFESSLGLNKTSLFYRSPFLHLSRQLGCFCNLAVVNSTTVNTDVKVSLGYIDSESFRDIQQW